MSRGWTVNLSVRGFDREVDLPSPPLFVTRVGPVVEIVFWSDAVSRWIHGVSEQFPRRLPEGHVQVAYQDLAWVRGLVGQMGAAGLRHCIGGIEDYHRRMTSGLVD